MPRAAEKLLAQDVAPKVADVNARVSVPLFQGQFDAVLSWTYNLGEGALKSSTMLKKINAARPEEVPAQIKRWNQAGGKVLKGLVGYPRKAGQFVTSRLQPPEVSAARDGPFGYFG
jgi:lysozyme